MTEVTYHSNQSHRLVIADMMYNWKESSYFMLSAAMDQLHVLPLP